MRLPSAALLLSSQALQQHQPCRAPLPPFQVAGWIAGTRSARTSLKAVPPLNYYENAHDLPPPWDINDAQAQLHDLNHLNSNPQTDLFRGPNIPSDDMRHSSWPMLHNGTPGDQKMIFDDMPRQTGPVIRSDLSQLAGLGSEMHSVGRKKSSPSFFDSVRSSYTPGGRDWGQQLHANSTPRGGPPPSINGNYKRDLTVVEPVRGVRGIEELQHNKNIPKAYYRQPPRDVPLIQDTSRLRQASEVRIAPTDETCRYPTRRYNGTGPQVQPYSPTVQANGIRAFPTSGGRPHLPPSNVQRYHSPTNNYKKDLTTVLNVNGIHQSAPYPPQGGRAPARYNEGKGYKQDLGGPRNPVSEIHQATPVGERMYGPPPPREQQQSNGAYGHPPPGGYEPRNGLYGPPDHRNGRGSPVSEILFQEPPPGSPQLQQHVPNNSQQQFKKDVSFVQGPKNEIHSVGRAGGRPPHQGYSPQPFRDMSQLAGNTGSEIRGVGTKGIQMPKYSPGAMPYNSTAPAARRPFRSDVSQLKGGQSGIHQVNVRGSPPNNYR